MVSSSVYSFLCGFKPSDIIVSIDEIPIEAVRNTLKKVVDIIIMSYIMFILPQIMEVNECNELQSLLQENFDLITESGYTKPLLRCGLEDKTSIVHSVALHQVILRSLGELCQFRDGLEALKVAQALKVHGNLLRPFFCNDQDLKKPLTAGIRIATSSYSIITNLIIQIT